MTHKLGMQRGDQWVEHSHPAVYDRQDMGGGHGDRLHVALPGGDPDIFRRLLRCLEPPYFLLYILHTPRGEGEPGRYESPELSGREVDAFLVWFSDYLRADGRFHLWAHSRASAATLVWDNHNIVYAYGPLDDYETQLKQLGFSTGALPIPTPHAHNYRPECDADAEELLQHWPWTKSPLQPQDN